MAVELKCELVGRLCGGKWDKGFDISRRVYSVDGLAPTIHTCGGGNIERNKPYRNDKTGRIQNGNTDRNKGRTYTQADRARVFKAYGR